MASPAEKNPFYIKPAELKEELRELRRTGFPSEKLGDMLLKLARKFATRWNYCDYTFKEEFIGDAVLRMVQNAAKVDPDKNPFSYLTTICANCFAGRIKKENKYGDLKKILSEDMLDELSATEGVTINKHDDDFPGDEKWDSDFVEFRETVENNKKKKSKDEMPKEL